jgi:hypothetical protein
MLRGVFSIRSYIQMNQRIALRSRSAMKLSTAAPRRSRKEWPTTSRRVYPRALGAEFDAKSLIAVLGANHRGDNDDSGGSNVCENPVENWNGVIDGLKENESPGESIGLPRKHRGGVPPLRSGFCDDQRVSRIDDPNRKKWRDLRKCQTRADASRFAEAVGACVSSNLGSLWRFEDRSACRLKNQLLLSRRSKRGRTSMAADLRHVAACSRCVHLVAVGFLGPSEPTELLLPLRPILRRFRAVVFANSPRDPDARVRNLPATSVSTREGTERVPVFYASRSSNRTAPPRGWVSG